MDSRPKLPKVDNLPISPSEKLVREVIEKLNENAEEIKHLREQIEKKGTTSK